MTVPASLVGLSYPKPRALQTKIFAVARTDSSTPKCALPKGAIIVGVHVYQNVNATTGAATFNVGWSGATTAILNSFSMATTAVGLVNPGTTIGSGVFTPLTADQTVLCTYSVGTSTAGGTGYVIIEYFVPASSGEAVDD